MERYYKANVTGFGGKEITAEGIINSLKENWYWLAIAAALAVLRLDKVILGRK